MAAYILAPVAQLENKLLSTIVHPLFPYPLLSTIHAARISLVHQALSKKAQAGAKPNERGKTTWAYDIAGFLIMSWGGAFLTNFILGQTPIQLVSIHPLVNYLSVHLFLTFALRFVSAPAAKVIDTALVLIDGTLRMQAVIGSIGMAISSQNANVHNSLFVQVVLGTLGATGGGQLAGMLGIHSPLGWSFNTPPVLRATSLAESIDVVAACLCSILFGLTTLTHPSYLPVLALLHKDNGKALLSPTGARALCTLVFATAFAYRAVRLHWLPATIAVTTKVSPARAAKVERR